MRLKRSGVGGWVKTQSKDDKSCECANSVTDCDSWAQCEVCDKWFHTICQTYQMRRMLSYKKTWNCIGVENCAIEECPNY